MMERIRVMVTGVGGGGNGEQLVKALKMSEKNYYLIGADITPVSKGLFLVDQKRILPPASDPNYIEALLKVCKEEGFHTKYCCSCICFAWVDSIWDICFYRADYFYRGFSFGSQRTT